MAVEMIRALDSFSTKRLTSILNKIFNSGESSDDMCKLVFITKSFRERNKSSSKGNAEDNLERTRGRIRNEIAGEQDGFVEEIGTRNAILFIRMLSERNIDMQRDISVFLGNERPSTRLSMKF